MRLDEVFHFKGAECKCQQRKGLVSPLPPAVFWPHARALTLTLAVLRGTGLGWGQVDKPMSTEPCPLPCCGHR